MPFENAKSESMKTNSGGTLAGLLGLSAVFATLLVFYSAEGVRGAEASKGAPLDLTGKVETPEGKPIAGASVFIDAAYPRIGPSPI
jgi:hypothetical protein